MNAIRGVTVTAICLLSSAVLGAGIAVDKDLGRLDPKTGFFTTTVYDKEADVLKKIYSDSEGNVVYVLEFKDITSGKRYKEVIDEKTGKPTIVVSQAAEPAKPEIHRTTKDVDPATGETVVTYYDAKGDKIGRFRLKITVGSERKKPAKEYSLPEPFKGVWIDPHRGGYIVFEGNSVQYNGVDSTCKWLHAALSYGDHEPSTFEIIFSANKEPGGLSSANGAAGRFSVGENLAFAEATISTIQEGRICLCYAAKKDGRLHYAEYGRVYHLQTGATSSGLAVVFEAGTGVSGMWARV